MQPSSRRNRSRLSPDAGFAALKQRIIARTGHAYYQDKDDLLWERVQRRLAATGLGDSTAYLERLEDTGRGEAEWAALEAEITIGETFFFRYAEQFDALATRILPELIARNRDRRRIRIWSAGCASGAEPYSIAIVLRNLLGDAWDDWHVSIVGTDMNAAAIAAARRAEFGRWALRSLSDGDRTRYFRQASATTWSLRPAWRSAVQFERHNLLSLLDGTSPLQFTDFDLILCRNVLIYFHPDMAIRIVAALGACLVDDGWLLIGHAEPNPAFAAFLRPVNLPGTTVYRRGQVPEPPTVVVPAAFVPMLPPAPPPAAKPQSNPLPVPAERPQPQPVPSAAGLDDVVEAVRAQADRGELEAAQRTCRAGIEANPTSPALHFYDGLVARALGDGHEAEAAFRKAIYLDRDFALAHHHLGLLLLDTGRVRAGRRSIGHAARIAGAMDGTLLLDQGDGMTAGALRRVARLPLMSRERAGNAAGRS